MNLRSRLRSPARPISVEERPRESDAAGNALRIPNVRLYLFGQSLSNIGTFFQILALSLLVLHLTGSGFALGATLSLGAVPFLTVGPWAGVIIDRVQIRLLLMVTSTLACLQALAIGLLISSGHINLG